MGGRIHHGQSTRITISSTDLNNQQTAALEIVFHEASHGLSGKVFNLERQEVERRHQLLPHPALWHAIIFYTAGELVARQIPGYTPLADRLKLWPQSWPGYRDVLEKYWAPHIDGKVDLTTALERTISDLLAQPGKPRQESLHLPFGVLAPGSCCGLALRPRSL